MLLSAYRVNSGASCIAFPSHLHLDKVQPPHHHSFDTGVGGFTYSNQHLQVATRLASRDLYGLGESHHQSFRHDLDYRTWPTFARDQPPGPVSGKAEGRGGRGEQFLFVRAAA